jgi:hypothetical protein
MKKHGILYIVGGISCLIAALYTYYLIVPPVSNSVLKIVFEGDIHEFKVNERADLEFRLYNPMFLPILVGPVRSASIRIYRQYPPGPFEPFILDHLASLEPHWMNAYGKGSPITCPFTPAEPGIYILELLVEMVDSGNKPYYLFYMDTLLVSW